MNRMAPIQSKTSIAQRCIEGDANHVVEDISETGWRFISFDGIEMDHQQVPGAGLVEKGKQGRVAHITAIPKVVFAERFFHE